MTATTLADPMFASIFNTAVAEPYDADAVRQALINHGRKLMNAETSTQIQCDTTEEHSHAVPSTTLITSSPQTGQAVPNQTIQGVSGASYAPMDTSPQQAVEQSNSKINIAVMQVTRSLENLVNALRTAENPQANLEEAVSTTLEQADWFRERLSDEVLEAVDEKDFDYEIGNHVERYMRNVFDANDHYDFDAEVRSRVEDEIESVIDGLVADAVEERLADLLEEKLKNANINITF